MSDRRITAGRDRLNIRRDSKNFLYVRDVKFARLVPERQSIQFLRENGRAWQSDRFVEMTIPAFLAELERVCEALPGVRR